MSMTATVLIGHSHNLTGEIYPTHMARLVESGRPAWVLHPLLDAGEATVWLPYEPDRIFLDLLGCIGVTLFGTDPGTERLTRPRVDLRQSDASKVDRVADVVLGSTGLALSVSLMEGSSLHRWRPAFVSMENVDVELLESTWSRKYSHWGHEWVESDRNADRTQNSRT